MSITQQLTRLARNVGALTADINAIFEALRAKGVNVPANAQLSDVADMIESIVPPHYNEVEIGGRWYPYVQIGNQLWLAENLDWKFPYNGGTVPIGIENMPTTPAAWYYNDDETQYGQYGLLYNFYCIETLNSLIPAGWRVPTKDDFNLLSQISVTELKSIAWNGDNTSGFNAIPSGRQGTAKLESSTIVVYKSFAGLGDYVSYWTSTIAGTLGGFDLGWCVQLSSLFEYSDQYAPYGMSIRLVKDVT